MSKKEEQKAEFYSSERIKELSKIDEDFRKELEETEKRVIHNFLKDKNVAMLLFERKKIKHD